MKNAKTRHTLLARAQEYIDYRRSLGYRMESDGKLVLQFARWVDELGHRGPVTTALALRWATLPAQAAKTYHAHRISGPVLRALLRFV
jgi:hypothetical protein